MGFWRKELRLMKREWKQLLLVWGFGVFLCFAIPLTMMRYFEIWSPTCAYPAYGGTICLKK